MERSEREKWIEEHYTDLLKEAAIRRYANAQDVVQQTVMRLLESAAFGAGTMGLWPFAKSAMKSVAHHERRSEERQGAVLTEAEVQADPGTYWSRSVNPEDTDGFDRVDYRRTISGSGGASLNGGALELVGGPGGIARWDYQQVRDERLFAQRWLAGRHAHGVAGSRGCHQIDLYHGADCECGGLSPRNAAAAAYPAPTDYRRAR